MKVPVYALIFSMIAGFAAALDEPEGFKDFKFGMSSSQVREILRSRGDVSRITIKDQIGDVSVDLSLAYYWDRLEPTNPIQRLGLIGLYFPEYNFSVVRGAYIERYGTPNSVTDVQYTSGFGAKFSGKVLTWQGNRVTITLSQYSAKRTESSVTMWTTNWTESRNSDDRDRAKKAAGDLR